MTHQKQLTQIAILDDYQQVALEMADWSKVREKAALTVFYDHESDPTALVERLRPFEIICVMRERTPLNREILSRLPELRLIVSTGMFNASIDAKAAGEFGIGIVNTRYNFNAAPELTWSLLLALARNILQENAAFRSGGWQHTIGADLFGKTIGIVGLGNNGTAIARYALAFGMNVIAWSEHLTKEKALQAGAQLVSKEALFREADFVTVHLVLSSRSKGIISTAEFGWMKPTAYFINTSRGPLVNEDALLAALQERKIAGAALDVFDQEPLPADHPLRKLDNVLCTSHIGYVTADTYRLFYEDTVDAILHWLK
jgi:phosphoglycerate dehydrogenase-like enzyme